VNAPLRLMTSCVAPANAAGLERIAHDASQLRRWGAFVELAAFHRVLPRVARSLDAAQVQLPADVAEELGTRVRSEAEHSLRLTATLLGVLEILDRDEVVAVPFKGPLLAQHLYGDLAARASVDVDILVPEAQARRARQALERSGLRFWLDMRSDEEQRFLRYSNEYGLVNDDGIIVELAWRFVPRYMAVELPLGPMLSRLTSVDVAGRSIPSLDDEDLLLGLVVHGSKHAWDRLLWLSDIAQLLTVRPTIDWTRVLGRAKAARVGRMLATALLLVRELFNVPIPEHVERWVSSDPAAAAIADAIGRRFEAPSHDRLLDPVVVRMRERPLDRLRFVSRLAFTPTVEDWRFVRLPPALSWAYPAVRPLRLGEKYLRKR
jgi:hypothetical protein